MSLLPVLPACRLTEKALDQGWLVEGLWSEEAVGVVGGEPKCCKSFLALDIAVSVAAGVPCLRRYPVQRSGRVLLFAAEDALHIVRRRIEGICAAAGLRIEDLDLQVITAPSVRLDMPADRAALEETILALRPRLLVLDPFVRLHRIDENASGEVAPLLAFLRDLQRRHALAVILVHHARKGAGSLRGGQALRGSSEFHAWGDSNLYLRRDREDLILTVEHRAAAAMAPLMLELAEQDDALALAIAAPRSAPDHARSSLDERIKTVLAEAPTPQALADIRAKCRTRNATLHQRLAALVADGAVVKTPDGYSLAGI